MRGHSPNILSNLAGGTTTEGEKEKRKKKKAKVVPPPGGAATTAVTVGTGTAATTTTPTAAVVEDIICGFFISKGGCKKNPCTRKHRKPLSTDADAIAKYYKTFPFKVQAMF